MIIPFFVKSGSIGDIDVEPGTTVGKLRAILAGAGYDVTEAKVQVNRCEEGDKLRGAVDGYALKLGDTVELRTKRIHTPNMDAYCKTMECDREQGCRGQAKAEEENGKHCNCSCSCEQRGDAERLAELLNGLFDELRKKLGKGSPARGCDVRITFMD